MSEDDKLTVARARKIQKFLSQPFFMSEIFTGRKGKFVELKDTIEGFSGKDIIIQLFWKERETTIPKPHSICRAHWNKLSKRAKDWPCKPPKNDNYYPNKLNLEI